MKLRLANSKKFISKILKKSLPPTLLCLFLFFVNLTFFGYKNAIVAIPMAFIFNRLRKLSPEKWHPYSILLISLSLSFFAYLATLNIWLSISIDFFITYLMVFFLVDSDTSKTYFSYGFGFVLFQSFSISLNEMADRFIAVSFSSLVIFIALVSLFLITKQQTGYHFDKNILNPLYQFKVKVDTSLKTFAKAFNELFKIFKIRIFSFHRINLDATTFDFRKTRFAFRISLLVTLSFLLERILGIPKGYWLPLNVFIMTLPFYEDSIIKIKERIGGNIAGVFISAILLHFLTGYAWHMTILCIATFFAYAVDKYTFRSAYMTCYAIALSTLFMKDAEVFELRLAYVFLAAIISIIGSRFIFVNKKENAS